MAIGDKMLLMIDKFEFGYWLQKQRESKGWSQADLSRHSGLHRAVINKVESGTRPMPETLTALANAFKISPITIFRKAGLLPDQQPEDEATFEDWKTILAQMTPEDAQEMREIALIRIERRKKSDTRPRPTTGSLKHRTSEN